MKTLVIVLLLLTACIELSSQVSLQQSFNYSATITRVNDDSYKYFLMDVPNRQCRIYNTDFSLWKTIDTPLSEGEWLYDVRFVSENIFNDDSQIELLYTSYKWITTNMNSGEGYYVYHSKVISETGTVILDVPGALYSYIHETGDDEYSLFLYVYDLSVDPYTIRTDIYSIPGEFDDIGEISLKSAGTRTYPNPADSYIDIEYNLPPGCGTASLYVLDSSGKHHKVFIVDGFRDILRLDIGELPTGIYFYHLESGGYRFGNGKFMVK